MHWIFSQTERKLKGYVGKGQLIDGSSEGALLCEFDCRNDTVGPIGTDDPYGHDGPCPPGSFILGAPEPNSSTHDMNAMGFWFTLVLDSVAGLMAAHGRAGIGVHGGGSASPNPLASMQGWYPTEGCFRLQNVDNDAFAAAVRRDFALGATPTFDKVL